MKTYTTPGDLTYVNFHGSMVELEQMKRNMARDREIRAIENSPDGLAITVILVAAVVAIVFVACRAMGVAIPGWVVQVFWILVIAVVCIFAIKLLLGVA